MAVNDAIEISYNDFQRMGFVILYNGLKLTFDTFLAPGSSPQSRRFKRFEQLLHEKTHSFYMSPRISMRGCVNLKLDWSEGLWFH